MLQSTRPFRRKLLARKNEPAFSVSLLAVRGLKATPFGGFAHTVQMASDVAHHTVSLSKVPDKVHWLILDPYSDMCEKQCSAFLFALESHQLCMCHQL